MGLENMDTDLDTTLTDTSQQQQVQQQQQVVQQQQQQVVAQGGGGMETDELIPTLPELGEELSRDFINTIFSANPVVENELTWL
jgi:type II secretory pathway pseudopilin PulG